jgi:hypothetical protein
MQLRSGAIRIEDRRIHIADKDALSQWTQPYQESTQRTVYTVRCVYLCIRPQPENV